MLQSLSVRNFILIDELELEFEQGLCVITGETGAGKSILMEAILFCLGARFSSDIIRVGADTCSITAIFSLTNAIKTFLSTVQLECSGEELIIKRIQMQGGRKKFLINDQVVTAKTLEQVADYLYEIHGQHNHTLLINSASHLGILDNFGELNPLKEIISENFREYNNLKKEIAEIDREKTNFEREIDYLGFVSEELSKLNIQVGEEEALANSRQRLQHREKEIQLIQDLLLHLENSDIDQTVNKAMRIIARSGKQEEQFSSISKNLDDAYNSVEEARERLKSLANNFDAGNDKVEDVEERLFKIRELSRKYGVAADELPAFLSESNEKLKKLQKKISNSAELTQRLKVVKERYYQQANILSDSRQKNAINLEKKVQQELAPLKMEKTIFKVEIVMNLTEEPTLSGIDTVRFIASTNPGMPLAPIDKIASGGELSRFMLALRVALFDKVLSPTIIFDEIDTGIGGIVADSIGDRLKKLSGAVQVIVITHQPQVAAKAMQHILVKKTQSAIKTNVEVKSLSIEEKIAEIARMISGKTITESSLKAAKELLT